MSNDDATTKLPAPISLTLEEASKVAAGSSGLALSAVQTWWWKGQPAFSYLNGATQVVSPANVAIAPVAAY